MAESQHSRLATFEQLAAGRRSVRRYTDQPIAPALLEDLLHCATWAPSAHNRQPWRFCVVASDHAKHALSRHMADKWRQDLAADQADPAFIERRVAVSHARITGAAALIVACMCMDEMDHYPDSQRQHAEWTMATQSVALACQNLLLAAHSADLAACWMCAPLFVPKLVRAVLELPPTWEPQALITLGYPAEEKQTARAPLESRVVWR